eukprot:Sspe_Gene.58811::Locus_32293_Transcript_2_2_Confidence_0.667_Length_2102::g.58811::m.58811
MLWCKSVGRTARLWARRGVSTWADEGRVHHRDFPPVVAEGGGDDLLEFTDPVMRHERFDRNTRITDPRDLPLSAEQREVLEQRLDRQMLGKVRSSEISGRVREMLPKVKAELRGKILVGDEIPDMVQRVVVTHLGSIDGTDTDITEIDDGVPPVLPLRKAKAYAEKLGMSLCLVAMSECGTVGYARLRHLEAWLSAEGRRVIANQTVQMQLNEERRTEGEVFEFRANIDQPDLEKHAVRICEKLWNRQAVRVTVKHAVTKRDQAMMLMHVCEFVQRAAEATGKPMVAFRQGPPMFGRLSATMVLTPLGEGRTKSKLIDHRMMFELALAAENQDVRDLNDKVDASSRGREHVEECHRRIFHGTQEDFVSTKLRDPVRIDLSEPMMEPSTNHEVQLKEFDDRMRLAGQYVAPDSRFPGRTEYEEQETMGWEKHEEEMYGSVEYRKHGEVERDPRMGERTTFQGRSHHVLQENVPTELWRPDKFRPLYPSATP